MRPKKGCKTDLVNQLGDPNPSPNPSPNIHELMYALHAMSQDPEPGQSLASCVPAQQLQKKLCVLEVARCVKCIKTSYSDRAD